MDGGPKQQAFTDTLRKVLSITPEEMRKRLDSAKATDSEIRTKRSEQAQKSGKREK